MLMSLLGKDRKTSTKDTADWTCDGGISCWSKAQRSCGRAVVIHCVVVTVKSCMI
jgi:hypothetical protein